MDHTAFNESGQDHTLAVQANEFASLGIAPRKADKGNNSRRSGMKLIQEMLRWEPPPRADKRDFSQEFADKILKTRGLEAYIRYTQMFQDIESAQKYPRLLISEDCTELIDTIPNCVYAKDKNDEEIDDVAEFEGDDPYDTLRYLARAMTRFIIESKKSQQAFAEIQAIQDKLDNGGDMTEFYRMMEVRENNKTQ